VLHIVPQIRYLGFSHLREEGSLDYDRGFVRLQIQTNFDTTINRQQLSEAPGSAATTLPTTKRGEKMREERVWRDGEKR
jgi:hypothetical protein